MTATLSPVSINKPVNIASREFAAHKYEYYRALREQAPVHKGKLLVLDAYLLSRYDDCVAMLKDPRFIRDRSKDGGSKLPFPMPKSVQLLGDNMILADGDDHRRLRGLVHQAFTPRTLARLEDRVETLSRELLDNMAGKREIELIQDYALPIPVAIIAQMLGISDAEMTPFKRGLSVMTSGMTGPALAKTLLWDMPGVVGLLRSLIARKRAAPEDDILTALIHAEETGERLNEDELVSMAMLLITAGFETTYNLIANSIVTLLSQPAQLAWLQVEPERMGSAVEEVLRFSGPIQGTKPGYATEDVTLHGVTIPKGAMVMPLLGAANRDPAMFENPEAFDIARTPNKHLGFGMGVHYCLGAPLARLETRIALTNLVARFPELHLAISPDELHLQHMPLWERYERVPLRLN